MGSSVSWADYIAGHPERLPKSISTQTSGTWADLEPGEYRRVTRNWRRWKQRRLDRMSRPLEFRVEGDRVVDVRFRGLRG